MIVKRHTSQQRSSTIEIRKEDRRLHGCYFVVGLISVCLVAIGIAETEIQESDLFNLLEGDLRIKSDLYDPDSFSNESDMATNAEEAVWLNDDVVAVVPENKMVVTKSQTNSIERQLWQARITATEETKVSQSKNALEQVIRQVRAIEIEPKTQITESTIPVEPLQKAGEIERLEKISDLQIPQDVEIEDTEDEISDGSVTEQTLQFFKDASRQMDKLKNPLELAETLFKSGYLKEAAACYRETLNRMPTDERIVVHDKAWVLLQLGNCMQGENPQTALENYQAVINEFPDSPWAVLAKAKIQLINWYLKDQPIALISNMKSETDR